LSPVCRLAGDQLKRTRCWDAAGFFMRRRLPRCDGGPCDRFAPQGRRRGASRAAGERISACPLCRGQDGDL